MTAKRILLTLVFLSSTLLGISQLLSAQDFIASGNPYAPPVVWEENKKLAGVAPDLVNEIFTELSLPYSVRVLSDWERVQEAAKKGEIDLIVSAYRNDERSKYLNFSIPYLPEQTVIVVEKGREFKFSSWDALKGKRGVSGIGESYGQRFDSYRAENLDISYYRLERAIETLNLGKADYLIIDLYTALIYARLLHGEDSITILDPPVTTENFHLAVTKDSPLNDHLEAINEKLEEKIAGGKVNELVLAHFDRWQKKIAKRSEYLSRMSQQRTDSQKEYLIEQDETARQRVLETMINREGLPPAVE
ncbi:MAG: transporter substrate-binding domain-containing protein [Desulfofustis sp.]|nr:transporter substrate-binding domain-containing protein [Desulfofustis sp.]RZW25425.1 MAG: transporter substrate-binding domain-containing protein [Desulfobulbaceae bacterium]